MLEKIGEKLLTTVTEPFMLLAIGVIYGMFKVMMFDRKAFRDIYAALQEQSAGLAACNNSICGILPLISVLVYGKGGKEK